jgi:hypothetical protein
LLATPLFVVNSRIFIDRIAALRLPAMHQWPELAEDGGLMGYGPRFTQTLRQLARLGRPRAARRQARRHSGRATDPFRVCH